MAEYVTKRDVEEIVGKAVEDLTDVIAQFSARVDERFNKLEAQFDRLNDTLDAFLKRLDDIETDNQARDAQIARLERWVEAIAQKTGVRLEY